MDDVVVYMIILTIIIYIVYYINHFTFRSRCVTPSSWQCASAATSCWKNVRASFSGNCCVCFRNAKSSPPPASSSTSITLGRPSLNSPWLVWRKTSH